MRRRKQLDTRPPTTQNQREESEDLPLALEEAFRLRVFEEAFGSSEEGARALEQWHVGAPLPEAVRQHLRKLVQRAEVLPLDATTLLEKYRLKKC